MISFSRSYPSLPRGHGRNRDFRIRRVAGEVKPHQRVLLSFWGKNDVSPNKAPIEVEMAPIDLGIFVADCVGLLITIAEQAPTMKMSAHDRIHLLDLLDQLLDEHR